MIAGVLKLKFMKRITLFVALLLATIALKAQGAGAAYTVGDNFTMSVTAAGTNTGADPFKYVWYKNGVVWPGMISDHIDFANCQLYDAGTFKCDVSNSAGKTTASDFIITITPKVIPSTAPSASVITSKKTS